jgi:hypothetical protein
MTDIAATARTLGLSERDIQAHQETLQKGFRGQPRHAASPEADSVSDIAATARALGLSERDIRAQQEALQKDFRGQPRHAASREADSEADITATARALGLSERDIRAQQEALQTGFRGQTRHAISRETDSETDITATARALGLFERDLGEQQSAYEVYGADLKSRDLSMSSRSSQYVKTGATQTERSPLGPRHRRQAFKQDSRSRSWPETTRDTQEYIERGRNQFALKDIRWEPSHRQGPRVSFFSIPRRSSQ